MKLSKFEKITWIGIPLLSAILLIASVTFTPAKDPRLEKFLIIGTAFILLSLSGICALLAKLVEKDRSGASPAKEDN